MTAWLEGLRYLLLAGLFLFLYRVVRVVSEDIQAASGSRVGLLWVEEGPGPEKGQAFPVYPTTVVGTSPDSDIVLHDSACSPRHVRLVAHAEGFWVEDLGSASGTYLNDRRLEIPAPLRNGDRLRVGSTVLRFVEGRTSV